MQFTINRDVLLYNLNNVGKALSSKIVIPVLSGIKLDAFSDHLTLTVSSGEISIQARIEVGINLKVDEEGVVIVPGKYFIDIVRKVTSKNIDISLSEETIVKILADKSNFSLNVLDKLIYPEIKFEEKGVCITLDGTNFKQIVRKTTFATSPSEAKPVLTGVNLVCFKNKMEAIATDGYRLSKKYMIFDHDYQDVNVIIPGRSLDEFNKIVEDDDTIVEMYFDSMKVLFKYKNILFLTRLIDKGYPKVDQLIPNDFILSAKFNKQELMNAIDRAALFTTNDNSNIIKMTFKGNENVKVASTTNQIGTVLEEVTPIECTQNVSFRVAFSSKYFLEALRVFDSPEVSIHFTSEIKPFIITGDKDINLIELMLPVRS